MPGLEGITAGACIDTVRLSCPWPWTRCDSHGLGKSFVMSWCSVYCDVLTTVFNFKRSRKNIISIIKICDTQNTVIFNFYYSLPIEDKREH